MSGRHAGHARRSRRPAPNGAPSRARRHRRCIRRRCRRRRAGTPTPAPARACAPVARRSARVARVGDVHGCRTQRQRPLLLMAVLGDDVDRTGRRQLTQRQQRQQPDRAGPDDDDGRAGRDVHAPHRMHGARQRLDQYGPLVRQIVRDDVQLALMGDESPAPSATGVGAETGLQAGRQRTRGDVVAAALLSGFAPPALLGSARRARQHRVEHHPADPRGTPGRSSSVSPTISWPGVNGIDAIGDRYGEYCAREQPQVGSTDAGETWRRPWSSPAPADRGEGRVISRSGATLPATVPASRLPRAVDVTERATMYRAGERWYSSARFIAAPRCRRCRPAPPTGPGCARPSGGCASACAWRADTGGRRG